MRSIASSVLIALLLCGCATPLRQPVRGPAPLQHGMDLLRLASQQIGAPYRFGGASPQGFDCSGLVRYAHAQLGLQIPRTAAAQHAAITPVEFGQLAPGDLVFFVGEHGVIDHVGIYAGDGRFLHAPRPGRSVGLDRLDDGGYFSQRLVGAGTFWPRH